jgi:hypothetical protein
MRGNDIDFKKIIKKARSYPDLESWKVGDPVSYRIAEEHNILERHEICRHMQPQALSKISWQDILSDIHRYKTMNTWKNSAPTFYWKCVREGWLHRPEIVDHFGSNSVLRNFTIYAAIQLSRRYGGLKAWSEYDPKTYNIARSKGYLNSPLLQGSDDLFDIDVDTIVEKLILARGYLIGKKSVLKTGFPDDVEKKLVELANAGKIYKLYGDIYIKSPIAQRPLPLAQMEISAALIKEEKWNAAPCCSTCAFERTLPLKRNTGYGLEIDGDPFDIDLSHIFPHVEKSEAVLKVVKTSPQRLEMHQTEEGRVLRALMGTRRTHLDEAAPLLLKQLNSMQIMEVKRLTRYVTPAVKKAVQSYLA